MKTFWRYLAKLKILLLLSLFVSCGGWLKEFTKNIELNEMEQVIKDQFHNRDSSLSEMSREEFQQVAEKYFSNTRVKVTSFVFVDKGVNGNFMKKENTLYYVQSFLARGEMNADKTLADIQIGIYVAGEMFFISDVTYSLIINDFVCDEMACEIINNAANKIDDSSVYAVGWKAELY